MRTREATNPPSSPLRHLVSRDEARRRPGQCLVELGDAAPEPLERALVIRTSPKCLAVAPTSEMWLAWLASRKL